MPKVELISYTKEPEKLIACAAKLCYSSAGANEKIFLKKKNYVRTKKVKA